MGQGPRHRALSPSAPAGEAVTMALFPSGAAKLKKAILGDNDELAEHAAEELLRRLEMPLLDVVTEHFQGELTARVWDLLCDADRRLHPEHDTERATA